MGFGLWIDRDNGLAWAQGTHEYRPMGAAVISSTDQFRRSRFPAEVAQASEERLQNSRSRGFSGSLEEVNTRLR